MDYIIETDFEGPNFVMVPNAVARSGKLSPEALGVLVYLASMPRGFLARVSSVQEAFSIGKDKWQRIARELRDCGAMQLQSVRGAGGRVVGRRVAVRWPSFEAVTESRVSRPSVASASSVHRKPEKPTVGKPAKVSGQTRQSERANPAPYKEQRKKPGAVLSSASVRPSADPLLPCEGQAVPPSPGDAAAAMLRRIALAKSLGLRPLNPSSGDFSQERLLGNEGGVV